MEIRVFFLDGAYRDFTIQTYYQERENLYALILENGDCKLIDNVSHMVKLA